MTPDWSGALEILLREVEGSAVSSLERAFVSRDLRGQLRLAVRVRPGMILDVSSLEQRIERSLGGWFSGPILSTSATSPDVRRLATLLTQETKWPDHWPGGFDNGIGGRTKLTMGLWAGAERLRTKHAWLSQQRSVPPWPLNEGTPAIVSFYSFKGGVGRTTTMCAVARLLAKQGRKVAIIDLDLEAPGVGRFLGAETPRGVIDLLVQFLATSSLSPGELDAYSVATSYGGNDLIVFPVGTIDWAYIEKLGHLDFSPQVQADDSPVEVALRALLLAVKSKYRPDFVFLDSRAGFHDLGGLSLNTLSHLDVLVGREGAATLDGFQLVIDAIARRKLPENQRVVVVQSFVAPPPGVSARDATKDWRAALWDCFESLDGTKEDRPAVDDATARHFPLPVPIYEQIAKAVRLFDVDEAVLDAEAFMAIRDRINEQCGRSAS